MSAAPIRIEEVPTTRHSPDDDLISIRITVHDLIAPGERYFNISQAEAARLIESLRTTLPTTAGFPLETDR